MAREHKSGSKNRGQRHSATTRIGRSVGPSARKRSRYSGKYLTLTIMDGAAFFVLKGCADDGNNDGDDASYSTASECIDDGNSATVCADGWNDTKAELCSNLPKQISKQSCQIRFGDCYLNSIDQSWVPISSSFLLSRVIHKNRDEQYVYSDDGSSCASRPVWHTASGDYGRRSGSGEHDTVTSYSYTTKKVSTISHGGYRRSSSTRGYWGG